MVYKFKLVSDEVNNFSREIEIDSNSTFLQLRNVIMDSVGFNKDDYDSFFLCDDQWNLQEEITLVDMGSSSDQDIWIMEDTPLNELIEEEGQKLVFMFDYMTQRSFFMELKEIITGMTLSQPICTMKKGTPPQQKIDQDEVDKMLEQANAKQQTEADLDMEEFYGDTDFNEDELGSGFDDLSMN